VALVLEKLVVSGGTVCQRFLPHRVPGFPAVVAKSKQAWGCFWLAQLNFFVDQVESNWRPGSEWRDEESKRTDPMKKLSLILVALLGVFSAYADDHSHGHGDYHGDHHGDYHGGYHGGHGYYAHGGHGGRYWHGGYYHGHYYDAGYYPGDAPFFVGLPLPVPIPVPPF
jgi:hypothetical protein